MTPLELHGVDQRFRRIAWGCIAFYGLVAVVLNLIHVEPPQREDFKQLSPRIAQLIVEAAKPPAPPVEVKKEEAAQTPEEAVEEKPAEEKPKEEVKEEPKTEPAQETPPPVEVAKQQGPTPEEIQAQQEAARKKNVEIAMNSGLLKILKQAPVAARPADEKVQKMFAQVKGLSTETSSQPSGTSAIEVSGATRGIDDIVAKLQKDLAGSKPILPDKAVTSGGIDAVVSEAKTDLPVGTGATALKEHQTTKVDSPFEVKGFEGGEIPRTMDQIAEVVDSYKGGITFLYNKYLRDNPSLRGVVTVEFLIASSGEVLDCKVVNSTMNFKPFEEALSKRILQWRFPPVSGGNMTIVYPIVFSVAG
jgi:TonB family protein